MERDDFKYTNPAFGPWRFTSQRGEPSRGCYQAQVWDDEGDLLATLEPTPDPVEARDNARFIAAAGTAAAKLPEGTDPMAVMRLLPEIYTIADWVAGSAKLEDEDGDLHPPDRELVYQLRTLLDDTRADQSAESDD